MKFLYKGKYSGDESTLPQRKHPEGFVPYKEPQDMKKLAIIANGIAVIIVIVLFGLAYLRIDQWLSNLHEYVFDDLLWGYAGLIASILVMIPHEFLHAICFKDEVWMFQNLKQGLLFVVGIEDMSKSRFIFMSMLPNIVFGMIPFLIYMLFPNLIFFGTLGIFSISAGAGDYINVFNTIVQVPKGALVYMSGMHSYWYMPKDEI